MLVDTHCHLDQFTNADAAVQKAADCGVDRIVAVSENPASMTAALALKHQHPQRVLTGLGLHPAWLVQAARPDIDAGLAFMQTHLAEADQVGEVGLDYKWATTPQQQALQDEILSAQFELAATHTKPVNLHSRRCLRQTMEHAIAFHQKTGLNAQLHWFTQSKKLIRTCNEVGVYVSVGPTVLDNPQTQDIALAIADPLLLLETDAPVPIGGQDGHPARTRQVAEKLAELKHWSLAELAERTSANFSRYLGLD